MRSLKNPSVGTARHLSSQGGSVSSSHAEARSPSQMFQSAMRQRSRGVLKVLESLPLPRNGFGHTFAVVFIVAGWLFGSVLGGSSSTLVAETAAVFGLKSTDIVITGQVETSEKQVFQSLKLGGSLLGFDAEEARSRLIELPWVKNAAIRKLYPGKLSVALAEKRAMAVWQHNDRLTVIEQTGAAITKFGISDLLNNKFSHLPHLVGEGAAEAAKEILPVASKYPAIAGRVSSYLRIANRRWDVKLANGLRIQLPEHGAPLALERLNELAGEMRLLEREVSIVDMRLPDRITLRLEPDAAKTRQELVTARMKAMKKADRKL